VLRSLFENAEAWEALADGALSSRVPARTVDEAADTLASLALLPARALRSLSRHLQLIKRLRWQSAMRGEGNGRSATSGGGGTGGAGDAPSVGGSRRPLSLPAVRPDTPESWAAQPPPTRAGARLVQADEELQRLAELEDTPGGGAGVAEAERPESPPAPIPQAILDAAGRLAMWGGTDAQRAGEEESGEPATPSGEDGSQSSRASALRSGPDHAAEHPAEHPAEAVVMDLLAHELCAAHGPGVLARAASTLAAAAALGRRPGLLRLLSASGGDVGGAAVGATTAMHCAAARGGEATVSLLLALGCVAQAQGRVDVAVRAAGRYAERVAELDAVAEARGVEVDVTAGLAAGEEAPTAEGVVGDAQMEPAVVSSHDEATGAAGTGEGSSKEESAEEEEQDAKEADAGLEGAAGSEGASSARTPDGAGSADERGAATGSDDTTEAQGSLKEDRRSGVDLAQPSASTGGSGLPAVAGTPHDAVSGARPDVCHNAVFGRPDGDEAAAVALGLGPGGSPDSPPSQGDTAQPSASPAADAACGDSAGDDGAETPAADSVDLDEATAADPEAPAERHQPANRSTATGGAGASDNVAESGDAGNPDRSGAGSLLPGAARPVTPPRARPRSAGAAGLPSDAAAAANHRALAGWLVQEEMRSTMGAWRGELVRRTGLSTAAQSEVQSAAEAAAGSSLEEAVRAGSTAAARLRDAQGGPAAGGSLRSRPPSASSLDVASRLARPASPLRTAAGRTRRAFGPETSPVRARQGGAPAGSPPRPLGVGAEGHRTRSRKALAGFDSAAMEAARMEEEDARLCEMGLSLARLGLSSATRLTNRQRRAMHPGHESSSNGELALRDAAYVSSSAFSKSLPPHLRLVGAADRYKQATARQSGPDRTARAQAEQMLSQVMAFAPTGRAGRKAALGGGASPAPVAEAKAPEWDAESAGRREDRGDVVSVAGGGRPAWLAGRDAADVAKALRAAQSLPQLMSTKTMRGVPGRALRRGGASGEALQGVFSGNYGQRRGGGRGRRRRRKQKVLSAGTTASPGRGAAGRSHDVVPRPDDVDDEDGGMVLPRLVFSPEAADITPGAKAASAGPGPVPRHAAETLLREALDAEAAGAARELERRRAARRVGARQRRQAGGGGNRPGDTVVLGSGQPVTPTRAGSGTLMVSVTRQGSAAQMAGVRAATDQLQRRLALAADVARATEARQEMLLSSPGDERMLARAAASEDFAGRLWRNGAAMAGHDDELSGSLRRARGRDAVSRAARLEEEQREREGAAERRRSVAMGARRARAAEFFESRKGGAKMHAVRAEEEHMRETAAMAAATRAATGPRGAHRGPLADGSMGLPRGAVGSSVAPGATAAYLSVEASGRLGSAGTRRATDAAAAGGGVLSHGPGALQRDAPAGTMYGWHADDDAGVSGARAPRLRPVPGGTDRTPSGRATMPDAGIGMGGYQHAGALDPWGSAPRVRSSSKEERKQFQDDAHLASVARRRFRSMGARTATPTRREDGADAARGFLGSIDHERPAPVRADRSDHQASATLQRPGSGRRG